MTRGRPPKHEAFASWLRAHPLSWAVFPARIGAQTARTYLSAIPTGKLRAFEAGKFEARLGGPGLLVRFVGGAQ